MADMLHVLWIYRSDRPCSPYPYWTWVCVTCGATHLHQKYGFRSEHRAWKNAKNKHGSAFSPVYVLANRRAPSLRG